jgi:heptosyltransferase-3
VSLLTAAAREDTVDLHNERIEKILLVRANFRLGNSILAIPAIFLLRKNFPRARIDFVGSPNARSLFQDLPIDHYYQITRRFPHASWAYLFLLKQIRSMDYDLAVELSCSQSALGAFIVGFSAARFRVGSQGRWDFWFNVKVPRAPRRNKYRALPGFFSAIGLEVQELFPSVTLSPAEKEEGRKKIAALVGQNRGPIVGVFVGGRKGRGKRWPRGHFLELTAALAQRLKVIVFVGPEEKDLIGFFTNALTTDVPLVFEPSLRLFASMVSNCHLFITCDTGPMHLACAVCVRTVAIFQDHDFYRWGPPSSLCRILHQPGGVLPNEVLKVSLAELSCGANHLRSRADSENKTG